MTKDTSRTMERKELYIKSIIVKGLWNAYNVFWNLQENFNILAGNNGSGKSTILNMVYEVLNRGSLSEHYHWNNLMSIC